MKKTTTFICFLACLCTNSIQAQSANLDFMQSIGKIYVVVAVIATIFIGIIIYLISLEKKIKKLENQIND